ncbi:MULTISPECIES: ABC transporter ATP-binding protein [Vibrio]|jgi:nitrate/nitrite transport system ATP-binding protein|uniref:ABC transporter ATP-binding protein n=5 Tax=Vibrio TaxID=662 RepID=A0A0B4IVK1_VIBHA|nr:MULTISPECIES: ABC transporter ATP-binding protein [Vibrio]MDW2293621.1 ABC transporter ATP-binding protein [Vibrio sp. 1404]MEA3482548.1 ABC transporter ATP-binding protein [Pseudomonadota bacterium]NAW55759.1 ATP-binding cassette domain-containing protein [Vibrio sp. V41_P2S12T139]NAW93608.1 ATP-binding cassette domain-containing protein [Vibrio sp. V42_P2S4T144]QCO87847.1 ABC transporter ATP-binding protein [Vibrio neocaledonicus]GAJ77811.1 nitrate ABC transporter, ATP-binding protein [V
MEKALLDLTRLGMRFPTPDGEFIALKNVDLQINKGEFVSLIGHSGCGKSTVLNLVAGLHMPTDGGVIVDGREVAGPGPDRAVVFQNHSLLPWLTVYQNVELAVKQIAGKKGKAWIQEQVNHYLELIQMQHAAHKKPDEISGGMKQRVGIARALALQPKVLLMDEPFGALDALTRAHLQDALMKIQAELNNTVIMITHDVDEAVLLSDKIVMMTNGPAATIGEVLEVNLPRPRERVALADDAQYQKCRQAVLKFLYEKQSKVEIPASKEDKPKTAAQTA